MTRPTRALGILTVLPVITLMIGWLLGSRHRHAYRTTRHTRRATTRQRHTGQAEPATDPIEEKIVRPSDDPEHDACEDNAGHPVETDRGIPDIATMRRVLDGLRAL